MAFEPPPNIMKAGERPARVRTGARTATKAQERDMLEKLRFLADHPEVLVPRWMGSGASPFDKHARRLRKAQSKRDKPRRLKWAARGKRLWNGYAATLLVALGEKIPSFAPLKFQGREIKFVYRPGTGRNALIGVQHYDDPEVRLLGYAEDAKRYKVMLVSSEDEFLAGPVGAQPPLAILAGTLDAQGVDVDTVDGAVRCRHPDAWRFTFEIPELRWNATLCLDCLAELNGDLSGLLERRVVGPEAKLRVERTLQGSPFRLLGVQGPEQFPGLQARAFRAAQAYAEEEFASYNDQELAQWTRDRLLKLLDERPEGYLLVGDDLWLSDFDEAARTYVESDLERRALQAAFKVKPPHLRTSDRSLTKILEPYWKQHGNAILGELAGGLLKPDELAQLARLTPSEAIASLARILGVRERFKEFLQFDTLDPLLDFVVTCLQIHRSGEKRVFGEKLHNGIKEPATRILALSVARGLGEQASIEWQYAPHEKESAAFLDPYVGEVMSAPPAKFAEALGKLAVALNVPPPARRAP